MDASPSDSSTLTRNPCSTAGLAHQAAHAWPPSVAAPTLYHHQWRRPRHRPSPQRRRGDNTNSGTLGAPSPAFDFSVPHWSHRRRRGTAAPNSFRSTHCKGGARHMAALASCGARWRRPTRAALALRKGPAAALGPGDGDGPPWLPNGCGAGGVKRRTEGGRRPPTGVAAAPGRRGNSGARRRHPGAAAAPKRRQRCPTRDPTAAVHGAGASP
ncbi:hypothetical protein PVAP13_5KG447507 [Panicum virgatum]|uniref:Uncharacterized protein n=1 Tax=Panicum virgatum TaxID=38727 RepID=A0A8T0SL84_PANVG|nr:hypothetical protein PVAP13_5KG447507 [Panicum virgatum]